MPKYICPRCHYETFKRSNIINHYKRKRSCPISYKDISVELLINNISNSILNTKNKDNNKYSTNVAQCSTKKLNLSQKCSTNVAQCDTKSLKNLKKTSKNTNKVFKCRYCSKIFKQHSSQYRHEKKFCKKKSLLNANEILTEKKEWAYEKKEFIKERKELLGYIDKLIDKTGNTTIHIDDHSNQIQNNIHSKTQNNQINYNDLPIQNKIENIPTVKKLRDFGDENMEHITHEFCKELLKEPYSGPNKLVRAIHFNPDYVENNNVQATNRKSNITKVVKGGEWEYINKNTLLKKLLVDICTMANAS